MVASNQEGILLFWSSDANSRFIGKVPDAGKDWGQKEKRASEDEMAGWHHRCSGHSIECFFLEYQLELSGVEKKNNSTQKIFNLQRKINLAMWTMKIELSIHMIHLRVVSNYLYKMINSLKLFHFYILKRKS